MKSGPFASCTASRTDMVEPLRDVQFGGDLHGCLTHGLTQSQGHDRRDVRDILAEHEHSIRVFHLIERR